MAIARVSMMTMTHQAANMVRLRLVTAGGSTDGRAGCRGCGRGAGGWPCCCG